jgi:hypothetical protein
MELCRSPIKQIGFVSPLLIKKLLVDGAKNAIITDSNWLNNLTNTLNGKLNPTTLNEKILSEYWGFGFSPKNFIFDSFNKIIVKLVESGISEKIIKDHKKELTPEIVEEHIVLTIDHLLIWFQIWLVCLILASFAFFLEKLWEFSKEAFLAKFYSFLN